ncbi:MAG TPA: hypothetical protein VGE74_16485 [Gemmata sp.]
MTGGVTVSAGRVVLRYGALIRGFALLSPLLPLAVLAEAIFCSDTGGRGANANLIFGGISLAFAVLAVYLLLEGFGRKIVLTEADISTFGWLGPAGVLRWDEIERVENKATSGKFLVHGQNTKIRLSHYLAGLDKFAEECKKRLAPEVYGKAFEKPLNRPFM